MNRLTRIPCVLRQRLRDTDAQYHVCCVVYGRTLMVYQTQYTEFPMFNVCVDECQITQDAKAIDIEDQRHMLQIVIQTCDLPEQSIDVSDILGKMQATWQGPARKDPYTA